MANYINIIIKWLLPLLGAIPGIVVIILFLKRIPQKWICRRLDIKRYQRLVLDCLVQRKNNFPYHVFRRYRYEPNCYVDRCLELYRPSGQPVSARDYLRGRIKNGDQFFLFLSGEFGIGKTALCFDFMHELFTCASYGNRYLPVYLPIREYRKNEVEEVSELLLNCLKKWGLERIYKGYGGIKHFLKKKHILLVVDSLDQIDESGDGNVPAKFLDDLHAYFIGTSSSIIVTVCSDYIEDKPPLYRAVRCYTWIKLREFNDRQALECLRRHMLKRKDFTLETEVYNRLCADVYLARLLSNPLLLNVVMHYGALEIPHIVDAGRIYHAYIEDWVMQDGHFDPFVIESRWSFIQEHALKLLRSESDAGIQIDSSSELLLLKKAKRQTERDKCIEHLTLTTSNKEIHYYDIEKGTRSFLRVNRDGTIGFVHRSVMYYFCARWAIDRLRNWEDENKATIDLRDLPRLYSNLIIWFMRSMVQADDKEWLFNNIRSKQLFVRRISYALLTGLTGKTNLKDSIRKLLQKEWDEEQRKGENIDMECLRHIAYGLGWAGGNPCSKDRLNFIQQHLSEWLESAFVYYHTPFRQREHCIGRLKAFKIGNHGYQNNRGLYILDLSNVGQPSDIDLIEPYTDPRREVDIEVRRLAFNTITQIIKRS